MTTVYDGFYLLDHHVNLGGGKLPWYTRRRNPIVGIVVHTPETLEDFSPPYDEAERVAAYGAGTTRASWHDSIDADSIIPMLPRTHTAWHVRGYNSSTVGMEIGAKATSWKKAPAEWVTGVLTNAAIRGRQHADATGVPIRLVTRAQLDKAIAAGDPSQGGVIGHGPLDPTRRTDPGKDFPWDRYLDLVNRQTGDNMAFTAEEEHELKAFVSELKKIGSNAGFVPALIADMRSNIITKDELDTAIAQALSNLGDGGTKDLVARQRIADIKAGLRKAGA